LNQNRKPFDDVRVRQAFACAIDQGALVRSPTGGRILPNGVLPPGMPGYTPEIKRLAHDPERARRLLAEAGYPNGAGLPPIIHTSANRASRPADCSRTSAPRSRRLASICAANCSAGASSVTG